MAATERLVDVNVTGSKFGGDGGGRVEPSIPIKEYVDARDDAIESRLESKLDKLATKGTIWTAVATGVAIMLAVLAFAGGQFNGGLAASGAYSSEIVAARQRDADQSRAIAQIGAKLDQLIVRDTVKKNGTPASK